MPWPPATTDVEQLKERPEVALLLASETVAVEGVKFDRNELTIYVGRTCILDACRALKDNKDLNYNAMMDVTCVDWYPNNPRFEVVYHLFSTSTKRRVRLKVKLVELDPSVDSLTPIFPSANFFEREVFDLFGIRFNGHPNLKRIMMPEGWNGHPLRKDYPVEGYR